MPFSSYTVINLRKLLRARGLPTTGKKICLIERLVISLKKEHGILKECSIQLSRVDLAPPTKQYKSVIQSKTNEVDGQRSIQLRTRSIITTTPRPTLRATTRLTLRATPQPQFLSRTNGRQNSNGDVNEKLMKFANEHTKATQAKDPKKNENANLNVSMTSRPTLQVTLRSTLRANIPIKQQQVAAPPEKKARRTVKETSKKQQTKSKSTHSIKIASTAMMLKPALRKNEMVWAHIKGFRNWPGIIEEEKPNGKYKIHFFGDYTTCDVSKSKIMHLMEGFKCYANASKPTALLVKAITEAQMFILDQKRNDCPICTMFQWKTSNKIQDQDEKGDESE